MEKPTFSVDIVMQRRALKSRWVDCVWEPWSVLPARAGDSVSKAPRLLVEDVNLAQWLHSGFTLVLHKDECEGYYLNVSAQDPRVFVLWRMAEEGEQRALPVEVTVSSDEAARWLD